MERNSKYSSLREELGIEVGSTETIEVTVTGVTEVTAAETEIDLTEDQEGTITPEDATTVEKMGILLENALNVLFFTESARKPR
jgi:hypothetical protein